MPSTRLVLDLFHLAQFDRATQRGVLRHTLQQLGIDLRTVGMAGIDALLDQTSTGVPSGPHPLISGWAWTTLRDHADRLSLRHDTSTPTPITQNASFRRVCEEESPRPYVQNGIPRYARNDGYLLSLHRADVLPMGVVHPHFDTPIVPPRAVTLEGFLAHEGWQLHSRILAPDALPTDWRSREQPWQFFGDAAKCGDLYLTTFRAGMSIAPLGMDGHRRSLGDIFTDRKISPYLRAGWPVIVNGAGMVVWFCGLIVAETVRVQPTTRQVRHLDWQLEMSNL